MCTHNAHTDLKQEETSVVRERLGKHFLANDGYSRSNRGTVGSGVFCAVRPDVNDSDPEEA
jgi:hypothetical protein